MNFDFFTIVLLTLCGAQAYVWYKFTQFENVVSVNIVALIARTLELQQQIDKLKEQLKKYEQQAKTVNS